MYFQIIQEQIGVEMILFYFLPNTIQRKRYTIFLFKLYHIIPENNRKQLNISIHV